jgi:recombination protein RecA
VPRHRLKEDSVPSPPIDPRRKALADIASRMKGWRPARQVLRRVKAVPTIFPWLDYASRVSGFPVGRVSVLHGPSSEGKTGCALGLGLSFLRKGHFFGLVDAEFGTPISWLEGLMEAHADDPLFLAKRPKSYEDTVDSVRELLKAIIEAKESGKVPDAAGLIVVDSIRKLVPENFMAKIAREGASGKKGVGIDGMRGMGAAIKAKMNAEWLDELNPLIYRADVAMLLIGRESQNREAAQSGGQEWKLTGGGALVFDTNGLLMRCERDWVREGPADDQRIVGERHDVGIYKSKVAGKPEQVEQWSFHTSNGAIAPEGFDLARDLVELGIELGAVRISGGWLSFGKQRWQGKQRAVKRISDDARLREELDRAVRARFRPVETEPISGSAASSKAR